MEQLIKVEIKDGIQVVDSRIIAKGLNINHKSLMETIREYQKDLEDLGILPFETAKLTQGRGRPETVTYLNELQCHFVVTLSRNTVEVVQFKKGLVLAFDAAKKEIKVLEEVIKESTDFIEKKRKYYQKKGYSEAWVEKRLESIEVRSELESEWRKRGITEARQFALLTSLLSKETFELTPKAHKELKGLKSQNLRDHMTLKELAFLTLAEVSTTEIAQTEDKQGLDENKEAALRGGKIAGDARRALEAQTGKKVVSALNFLPENPAKYIKK
ncbi:MAG: Rha family transcriptional regulator [Microscillaceae bacterium]|nr:Rha family transcriptional regulator [Microscillaceae bacterium]